ncbi:small ribosomal subunit protein uS17c-like [Primulina tabacum]|uniref:small ribosomal subunit protein uS17c-like n=1 Tax=Primulina tabacum TaxID=48773 RepID=UPI003F5A76DC
MSLLSPQVLQIKSLTLATPFLHGAAAATTHLGRNPRSPPYVQPSAAALPLIRAMRTMQGKVVCNASEKTVAVEVLRLAPHPKYKRRVRKKKTFQAHDPLNQFQVGDLVQLEKSRPISKTKTFWAVPVPGRSGSKDGAEAPQELVIPLESES